MMFHEISQPPANPILPGEGKRVRIGRRTDKRDTIYERNAETAAQKEARKQRELEARLAAKSSPTPAQPMTTDDYRRICSEVTADPDSKPADRLKAVELDAKLTGRLAVERATDASPLDALSPDQLRTLAMRFLAPEPTPMDSATDRPCS